MEEDRNTSKCSNKHAQFGQSRPLKNGDLGLLNNDDDILARLPNTKNGKN